MPLAFFVYYRVDPSAADSAREQVGMLFERLQQRCGVRGRLLTKHDEPNLWMEVYEGVADGARFEAALRAEAASAGLETALLPGDRRHLECFQE